MPSAQTALTSPADGLDLAVYRWDTNRSPRLGVVQIAHGVAEYAVRYDRLARALTEAGFTVYGSDHRGHGQSVTDEHPLGTFGEAGWAGLIADLAAVTRFVAAENPDQPLFLIGHSMGSFAAQQLIVDHPEPYAGVVLSGSTALDVLAQNLAASGAADLTAFNAGFKPRTGFEWLSRDDAEVDKYVADPLCGFDLADDVLPQIFSEAGRLGDPNVLAGVRSDLPVLLVSGQDDPLAGQGELITLLGQRYTAARLGDVTVQVYPAARHEVFNETNRDEVTALVVDWLKRHAG